MRGRVDASYTLDYDINLADQDDCRYDLSIAFEALNFDFQPYARANGATIRVSSTRDTGWTAKSGSRQLPLHMRIYVRAKMIEVRSGLRDCGHLTAASESYIKRLIVTFKHPGTGEEKAAAR